MSRRFQRGRGGTLDWEDVLANGHRTVRVVRTLFRHLPSDPRCKLCIAPFSGVGGKAAGLLGFGPSRMNPNFCSNCLERLPPGGAEVPVAVLFADVRGSTALGDSLNSVDFAGRMSRFYEAANKIIVTHDGLIDKLLGDEVMALFLPGLSGPEYRQRACDAAIELLRAVEGWMPIGIAIHAGPAFVGNVGGEGVFQFTALGDTINVGARLQSVAATGELVVTAEVLEAATLPGHVETRTVDLKGKPEPVTIHVLRAPVGAGRST
jgi:adenylate cyclase